MIVIVKRFVSKKIRVLVYLGIVTVALLISISLKINTVQAETFSTGRPKIGIALGGGGALGLAHIGVLKWLEENRIPVDYVAGTSMGGLIGGCYATGMSAGEIETFLKSINWNQLFDTVPPLKNVDFRRQEDQRDYSAEVEIGWKNQGVKLPQGLTGYRISLLLSRIALPYSSIQSFDELPIPFRCVAADIIHNEPWVMADGSLAEAMRATMAVPGVFTPVERDGRLLIDGGIFDNVPTDVAKKMGADVIIAVHLNADKGKPRDSKNSIVLFDTINAILEGNSQPSLGLADVVLEPQRGNLSMISWNSIDQFITYGYQVAAEQASQLKKYSLSEADWQQYLKQRNERKKSIHSSVPEQIMVLGASPQNETAIKSRLQTHLGKPLDPVRLEADLTDILGSSFYESLRYEYQIRDGIPTLVIKVVEKSYGPPFMDFAINMGIGGEQTQINPRVRLTAFNTSGLGSEWRTDIGVGTELYFFSELYNPIFASNFFVAPFVKFNQSTLGMFDNGYQINSYKNDNSEAGLDLGYSFEKSAELRAGYILGNQTLRQESGEEKPWDLNGGIRRAHLKWNFNNTDEMIFAKKGFEWKLEANWYDLAPGSPEPFGQVETQLIKCFPVGAKDRIFTMVAAGDSFQGTPPWAQQFRLGGPFRLGCYNINELSGNNYLLENIGYLKSLGAFPMSSRDIYLGIWYENGGVFENWSQQELKHDIAVGLVSTTIFGQVYLGISYGEEGNQSVNFILGHIF